MANYLSLPILHELVQFAEEDALYEDSIKAMASGILNYYFPATNGFTVAPEQNRQGNIADFIILRIQRRFPGDRGVVDHTVAEAKRDTDSITAALEQLENALEQANTEFGRCWAMLIHGCNFQFFEYHIHLPAGERLIPWGPPNQPSQNLFHCRNESVTIDWMLRHMGQNNTPPAR
ncbi:predicted protein [Histoplasma capsulatum G186AR]|uniref:Uncharacterized protein n=1 Tax=Ajellomyces capsulatus (strain G186AR / H82 / ATCC MYA-2454 / RMSCC 2432) TaxID=447093 RepID=C0NBW6_AJECG|nr:uncharacterized protein HCBG_00612 [Histoplasma capsulatum G186AR]EEH11157.1 predicted protein [Histoplasma capsulatum G186AR]